jgi:hypothetical protein
MVEGMKRLLFLFAILASVAYASVKVTTGPFISEDGTRYPNADACIAAVTNGLGADPRTCIRTIVVTGVCDEAVEPELPAEIEAIATQCPNDDTRWYLRAQGWKRNAFPACDWKLSMLPEQAPEFCTATLETAFTASPDDAPTPPIDPDFDEFSPTGPGPGPPGATTVDKP